MDKLQSEIDTLKASWMTGGSTDTVGPADWRELDVLSQLALTGQFTRVATRPATTNALNMRPELPALDLPPMDDALRPQLRRILESKLAPATDVVRLIAARGFCVNPIDWMPKRSDTDLPAIYTPWRDWLEGHVGGPDEDVLSAETWDTFPAHSRYQTLTNLHRTNPDAARTLIAAIAPTLAADQRLRILQCLRPALTAEDKSLLETFTSDRSSKVQTLIKTQLARLGKVAKTDQKTSAEVTDFLQVTRAGMLSRRKVISARKLKNTAQRNRRHAILSKTSLQAVSQALNVTPDDFVQMWNLGEANEEVAEIIATSGTDAQALNLAERTVEADVPISQSLLDRLRSDQRSHLGLSVMARDEWNFSRTRDWFPTPDGTVNIAAIDTVKTLPELITLCAQTEKTAQDARVADALSFLGLIADRAAATTLLDRLTAAGVISADPRLTLLRLNAAL